MIHITTRLAMVYGTEYWKSRETHSEVIVAEMRLLRWMNSVKRKHKIGEGKVNVYLHHLLALPSMWLMSLSKCGIIGLHCT